MYQCDSFLIGSTITASLESIIWSPNYPAAYDGNYDQVKQKITLISR